MKCTKSRDKTGRVRNTRKEIEDLSGIFFGLNIFFESMLDLQENKVNKYIASGPT